MFYTFVEKLGKNVYHKFVDDSGNRQKEVVSSVNLVLYIEGKQRAGSSKGLYGEILNPVFFSGIQDFNEFINEYNDIQKIHGQRNPVSQFISQKYPEDIHFDMKNINVLFIDIENAFDETGFPSPEKAEHPILCITIKMLGKGSFITFGTKESKKYKNRKDVIFIKCSSEYELLTKFQQHWRNEDPDIVSGWNIETYDIPYIINRMKQVVSPESVNKFSVFNTSTSLAVRERRINVANSSDKVQTYEILGITVMDFLFLYKKYSMKTLESYTLDFVANYELQEKKIDYSEYNDLMDLYNKDYDKYLEYNQRDVGLVERLENKLNFIYLAIIIAYLGKIGYGSIHSEIKFWDNHIYNSLLKKNIQIPPEVHHEKEPIVGAFVKNPNVGLYSWIVTLDLTSLYPSIIMTFNLSPETIVSDAIYGVEMIDDFIHGKLDLSRCITDNVSIIANGATFDNNKKGVFPELVEEMFSSRKKFKIDAIETSKKIQQVAIDSSELESLKAHYATMNAKQNAYKIVLNSLYGASANNYFRYNNRNIAEGITMTGQLIIRYISEKINNKINELFKTVGVDYIIFNDTDSMGINCQLLVDKMFKDQSDVNTIVSFLDRFVKTYLDPVLIKEFENLTKYLNAYKNALSMKREVIADRGLWRAKKNYILQIWDNEGVRYNESKLKMMGIETARSSTPKIVRGSLEKAIRIILNGTENELQNYVVDFRKQFNESDIKDISFPRGVSEINKWIDANGNFISGVPIHVRGSIVYNNLLREKNLSAIYPKIKNGDKIKFVYLNSNNPSRSHVISFLDDLPKEFGLNEYVDKTTQFEKTFLSPLESFTSIIHWSTEKKASLDSFFL